MGLSFFFKKKKRTVERSGRKYKRSRPSLEETSSDMKNVEEWRGTDPFVKSYINGIGRQKEFAQE